MLGQYINEGIEQAKEQTEIVVTEIARRMCKEIGIDAGTKSMKEIRAILTIRGMKFFRHSKMEDDTPTIYVYILKTTELVKAGRIQVDVEISEPNEHGETEMKVEVKGGILNAEGIKRMNNGFEEWMKNHASI